MNNRTLTSRAKSNTSNSNFNAYLPNWSKASSIEEEEFGTRNCRRKTHVEIINEEVKLSSSEEEYIGIRRCRRKSRVDIQDEEVKVSSSEEEDIVIRKFRRRSRVDIVNEEVEVCTSSSKQQNFPPEPSKTKEEISLEQMKKR